MTKYEWEKELKRNIARLPAAEIARVCDYYSELFEDKAERGYSERDIINEFGNPFDVAYKIMSEYDAENGLEQASPSNNSNNTVKATQTSDTPFTSDTSDDKKPKAKDKINSGLEKARVAINDTIEKVKYKVDKSDFTFATFLWKLVLFVPYIIVMSIIWTLVVSLGAVAVSFVVAGPIAMLSSFIALPNAGVFMAQLGMGLVVFGVGLLIFRIFIFLCKATAELTISYFVSVKAKANQVEQEDDEDEN